MTFKQRLNLVIHRAPKSNAEFFPYGKLRCLTAGHKHNQVKHSEELKNA